jgi:hypothetical protein
MTRLFFDAADGVFHIQGKDDPEKLIAPARSFYDGAVPSGNSLAAYALARLGWMTQNREFLDTSRATLEGFSAEIARRPESHTFACMALELHVLPVREIVVAGPRDHEATRAFLAKLHRAFAPRDVWLLHEPGPAGEDLRALVPFAREQGLVDGRPAAYVCENYACRAPVTEPSQLQPG